MANEIKLKRGSGSDPGTSDLSVGEVAIRTDNGKLFTKRDNGTVTEITGGGGIDDGDKGDITVSNSGATFTIDSGVISTAKIADDAVTYDKIQNVSATDRILGRDSSGAGVIEEITPANLRTMLNVADGATNVTNTNQLTNGAGFITATLTNEQVQDIVGGMLTGNTETGITVTYQDGDGTIDFVVGTLNQDTTGNAATATALETARTIAGVSFDGTANISLNNNAITNGAGYITSADGGNAATLDSIDSSQFLRSDANDSASGILTLTAGLSFGADARCAASVSSLSDGSTITVDFTSGIHHSVTLGGNRTFGNPSNDGSTVGQSGAIFITQDGTGSRTASFHSDYKFVGGTAPTLSTAANAVDRIDYVIKASGVIHCAVSLDVK